VTDDVDVAVAHVVAGAQRHLGERIVTTQRPNVLLGERTPARRG
jgi:hypothetical protein